MNDHEDVSTERIMMYNDTMDMKCVCVGGVNQAYIVGFQLLMDISPIARWIRWCMQVYA